MRNQKINCFYCGTLCEVLIVFETDGELVAVFKCPDCGRLARLKFILN